MTTPLKNPWKSWNGRWTKKPMKKCGQLQNTLIPYWNPSIKPIMKSCSCTKYAGNVAQLAIHLEELEQDIENTVEQSEAILDTVQKSASVSAAAPKAADVRMPETPKPVPEPKAEEPAPPEKPEDERGSSNQKILDLYRKGKSAVDIAKELGLGVGEVKLVIGLFREEDL